MTILLSFCKALAKRYSVLIDGGVGCGLDIYRPLALDAYLMLLGRAFYDTILRSPGARRIVHVGKAELTFMTAQVGCARTRLLAQRLLSRR